MGIWVELQKLRKKERQARTMKVGQIQPSSYSVFFICKPMLMPLRKGFQQKVTQGDATQVWFKFPCHLELKVVVSLSPKSQKMVLLKIKHVIFLCNCERLAW